MASSAQQVHLKPRINTTLTNFIDIYKPIDYAVIGQQKSGTSTLWNILVSNPSIKWVSHGKELFWFNAEVPESTHCDAQLEAYLAHVAHQRLLNNRTDVLVGDWCTTYFSCLCCPVVLKTINPDVKLVVVLRDPVQRVLSRFLEQKRSNLPFHKRVENFTFVDYTAMQLDDLEACLKRAAPFKARYGKTGSGSSSSDSSSGGGRRQLRGTASGLGGRRGLRNDHSSDHDSSGSGGQSEGGGGGQTTFNGWGAGLDVGRWMEMQCYARDHMYGWSAYDVFLENYLAHFPSKQILVVYTDDLSTQPMDTFKQVEAHIGAPPYSYDSARVSMVFNSRECYHWRCAKQRSELRPVTEQSEGTAPGAEPGPFAATLARLRAFYKPNMQRLAKWAEQGYITELPKTWQQLYG